MTRSSIVIRRIPDDDGVLVTYLPASELHRLLGCSDSTISRWMRMGCIRTTNLLAGRRNASVADAARLQRMTPKESLALGIRRIPLSELEQQEGWTNKAQHETRKRATHHYEEWDDYDVQYLLTAVQEGVPFEKVAKTLGRTYQAVVGRVDVLKREGELERTRQRDESWWERTRAYLTPEEREAIEA